MMNIDVELDADIMDLRPDNIDAMWAYRKLMHLYRYDTNVRRAVNKAAFMDELTNLARMTMVDSARRKNHV